MQLKEVLELLKKQPPSKKTTEIEQKIHEIKSICDAQYFRKKFHGAAALNRKIVLDKKIAELLTADVLLYLFSNPISVEMELVRDSGNTNIQDAIYWAFIEGPQVIKFLPNNDRPFNQELYENQKNEFETNTQLIIENIKKASGIDEIDLGNKLFQVSLHDQFEYIVKIIKTLKSQNKSEELLKVTGYSIEELRGQVSLGLMYLTRILKINLKEETIDSFCEKFLTDPNCMLHSEISHLFYDRAHITTGIEDDTPIEIGEKSYTYEDLFRVLVTKVTVNPDKYPRCAIDQLFIRMHLVDLHLLNLFKPLYQEITTPPLHTVAEKIIIPTTSGISTSTFFNSVGSNNNFSFGKIIIYREINGSLAFQFSSDKLAETFESNFKNIKLENQFVNMKLNQFKMNPQGYITRRDNEKKEIVYFMTYIAQPSGKLAINFTSEEKRNQFIKLLNINMSPPKVVEQLISQNAPDNIFTIYNNKPINTAIYFEKGLFVDAFQIIVIEDGKVKREINENSNNCSII